MAEFNLRQSYLETKKSLFDKYYEKLNDKQREAVYHINGPLLILAGAGSGKTTVLVNRLAYMIRYGNAYNSDICPTDVSESMIDEMKSALALDHDKLGDVYKRQVYRSSQMPALQLSTGRLYGTEPRNPYTNRRPLLRLRQLRR